MKRTYKKKSNLINKTGYTPGYDTEKNPVNYIPSEDITMANTPYPLKATPLDEYGNPIGDTMVMKPGGEYNFPGASYVKETPMFKDGGKSDWISAKISLLVKEGYPQKQAVAIAYSMYEDAKKEKGGYQLPMYQTAGTYNFGSGLPKPKFSADPNIATPEQFSEQMSAITKPKPYEYGLGKDPNYVNPLSEQSLTAGEDFKRKTDEMNKAAGIPQDFSKNIFGETSTAKTEDEKSKLAPPDIKGQEPFQFFNPYSGFDIPTAAANLGSSIESGDTLGTVGSGLKLATGLARNFFGGMGQERRKNYVTEQYYEKQREGMTGTGREKPLAKFGGYYQDGGMEQQEASQEQQIMQQVAQMLQQGADPQQVVEQLVQMGIPQEQAVQMVQAVMQPETPQLRRGGMMYYEDGGEEDFYEEDDDLINKYPNRRVSYEIENRVNENEPTDWYEEDMDKDTYYGFKQQLESEGYKSVPKTESKELEKEEEKVNYDKNSARDTWVAKTGMPWSEAKRLGYTDGSAKANIKLLSELNDPRFKKEKLRTKPLSPAKKTKVDSNPFGEPIKTFQQQLMEDFSNRPRLKENKPATSKKSSPVMSTREQIMEEYKDVNPWLTNNPYEAYRFKTRGYLQDGGYGEGDMVRYGGGNTGIEKKDLKALAKKYNKTPEDFLDIISNGDVREGGSMIRMGGANTGVPANWREEYKKSKPSTTGFRGALNKGLDYIGVDPIFNVGGYYQDGGEQQIAQQVAQAMQQGMQPQEAMSMLVESGMSEDQAMQLVQAIMEQMQQQGTPQLRKGGFYQEGGMEPSMEQQPQGDPTEAIMQQIAQMLEQGADPQQVMQMLVEAGIPEEQAAQMLEAVMQQMQGGEPGIENTPQMKNGGKYMQTLVGKTIKSYTYNPKTDSYIVSYE